MGMSKGGEEKRSKEKNLVRRIPVPGEDRGGGDVGARVEGIVARQRSDLLLEASPSSSLLVVHDLLGSLRLGRILRGGESMDVLKDLKWINQDERPNESNEDKEKEEEKGGGDRGKRRTFLRSLRALASSSSSRLRLDSAKFR
eukprot:762835-Hanusia_phi.AAC.1